LGLEASIQTLYPNIDEYLLNTLMNHYRAAFFSDDTPQSQLFSGAYNAIEHLYEAGFMLAIATGKSRRSLDKELETSDLEKFFPITRTAEETFLKPNPMMIDEIVVDYNVEIENALMIGDSEYDLQMANNFGMDSLAVACGVHGRERLFEQNPIGFVSTVSEIPDWLSSEINID
jgi:phosphoglycolate phosphatase